MKSPIKLIIIFCIYVGILNLAVACIQHSFFSLALAAVNFFCAWSIQRTDKKITYWDKKIKETQRDRQKIKLLGLKGDRPGIEKILEKYPEPNSKNIRKA